MIWCRGGPHAKTPHLKYAPPLLQVSKKYICMYSSESLKPSISFKFFLNTVDCVYGEWVWNDCPVTCGDSVQTGHRVILSQPIGEGAACNQSLDDSRPCSDDPSFTVDPCPGMPFLFRKGHFYTMEVSPDDCRWAPWDPWADCTSTCGSRDGTGNQTRTREIAIEEVNGGTPCDIAGEATNPDAARPCDEACPGKNI